MLVGQPIRRKEDERFLTGHGQFVDDVHPPRALFMGVVRSLHAHARIVAIDCQRALSMPGVRHAVSAGDHPEFSVPLPLREWGASDHPYCDLNLAPPYYPLARGEAYYQGQPVAVVLAESPYAAADGVEAVRVEYEPHPVVASIADALDGHHRVHEDFPNVVAHLKAQTGDVDAAFQTADIVFEERLVLPRLASLSIEGRGIAAAWDPAAPLLTLWSTNQAPYQLRDLVAGLLGLEQEQVRVLSGNIGGAFGGKGIAPEDIVASVLAMRLGRPVKWIETRQEYFFAAHARDQVHEVRVAATREGRLLALDLRLYKDFGAYNYNGPLVPSNTISHLPTHYRVPNMRAEAWCVLTHKVPARPTRGAGRPETTFVMDRVLDRLALATGLDPLEIRLRNIIGPGDMPYQTGLLYRDAVPVVYDGGNYPLMLQKAADLADYEGWRKRQRDLRDQGRFVGLSISSYLEGGGIGPSEGARIRVEPSGRVNVFVGVNSHGQGHATTLAQVCAEYLGARIEDVVVSGGDTTLMPVGHGTGASRVAVNSGNAVWKTSVELSHTIRRLAAQLLECDERDVRLEDSRAHVVGAPHRWLSFAEVAEAVRARRVTVETGTPELSAMEFFYPDTVTWSSGVHVAVVEVDPDSGVVRVLSYVVVHDCGLPLNPLVVGGQIDGGVAQGISVALGEELVYDGSAQLLSGTLMEYPLLRADDILPFKVDHVLCPTERNPLGIRAVGEGGAVSPPAAIAGAVEDALAGRVRVRRTPLSPHRVFELLRERRSAEEGRRGGGD